MEKQIYTDKQKCTALAALKEFLLSRPEGSRGPVLRDVGDLGEDNLRILLDDGTLKEVLPGWYVVCFAEKEDDPTDWYRAYWRFIVDYLDETYGGKWCLSAECSLDFYSCYTVIPEELVIRSKDARGTITGLPFGTALVQIRGEVPEDAVREERYGVRLFPLQKALLKVPAEFFRVHELEARTCVAMISDPTALIVCAKEEFYPDRARHIAAELQKIGREETATAITEAIDEYMKGAEGLFSVQPDKPAILRETGPVGNRIRLMWRRLRREVLMWKEGANSGARTRTAREVVLRMEDTLENGNPGVMDAPEFERDLPDCRPDYKTSPEESDGEEDEKLSRLMREMTKGIRKSSLLSRGTHEAFRLVARDILDSLTGGNKIQCLAAIHYPEWNYNLFKPGIDEGLFDRSVLVFDRRKAKDSCVPASRHIPVDPAAMDEAVHALSEVFQRETDPFVRAILGHFFIVYIQRFVSGNIQTAWLVMNSQLVAAGYPWLELPDYHREEYIRALKEAVELEHIERLVTLVIKLMRDSWRTDLRKIPARLEL
ncbi:MAG: Fic family protein, partial [Clostridia bacterium]|nr:Fic family protein [Clostridia bacterium]